MWEKKVLIVLFLLVLGLELYNSPYNLIKLIIILGVYAYMFLVVKYSKVECKTGLDRVKIEVNFLPSAKILKKFKNKFVLSDVEKQDRGVE